MASLKELKDQKRELLAKLDEVEKNVELTDADKLTAIKAMQEDEKAISAQLFGCEAASDLRGKLEAGSEVHDAKTGKRLQKVECDHPFSRESRKAMAYQVLNDDEYAKDLKDLFSANENFGDGRKKVDFGWDLSLKDATEGFNLMGEGLYGSTGPTAAGQAPFLPGAFGPGILPDFRPGIVEQLFYQLTLNDLIPSFATQSPNISYLTESVVNLQANATAEAGTFPFSSIEVARDYAQIGKVANALTISDEAVADAATLFNFVQGRLLLSLQRQEEVQILAANGYPGVSGLLSFASSFSTVYTDSIYQDASNYTSTTAFPASGTRGAGVQSQSLTSLAYGRRVVATGGGYPDPLTVSLHLKDAFVDIETTVFQSPTAVVMNPRDWQLLETAQDANLQFMNTSMFGNVYGVSRGPVKSLWGVPVVTTSLIPKGVVLTGWFDAQTVQIARRQGVQVQMTNSNESDFISGKITVRADERLGLLCYRPTAFELIHLG